MNKEKRMLSIVFCGCLLANLIQGSSMSLEPGRWVPILHYHYSPVNLPQSSSTFAAICIVWLTWSLFRWVRSAKVEG